MFDNMKTALYVPQTCSNRLCVLPLDLDNTDCEFLSPNEHKIADSLLGASRVKSFFAGRLAAKKCIAKLLQTENKLHFTDIDIARRENGSTYLIIKDEIVSNISVSISHGGKYAFACAAKDLSVGVDVEPISRKCVELKNTFADTGEIQILVLLNSIDQDEFYTKLFSAKEAAAKCFGTHMFFAFNYYKLKAVQKNNMIFEDLSNNSNLFTVQTDIMNDHVFSRMFSPSPII